MVQLTAPGGLPLATAPALDVRVAGAESNVAVGMAHLGADVEWFGGLGADPFGSRVLALLGGRGVRVDRVRPDPDRPTGLFAKDAAVPGSPVYYYRRGSAASALSPEHLPPLRTGERRLVHLSGITPALSASCAGLVDRVLTDRDDARARGTGAPLVSIDVNHRPGLWSAADAAQPLLALTRRADVAIVGRDEAQRLWGTAGAADVRRLLPDVPQVVVKDDDRGATVFTGSGEVFVPALRVEVIEPVGAGDAFAAGYLTGLLDGHDPAHRARLGHLMAALTLRDVDDLPPLPAAGHIHALAAGTEDDWTARLDRGVAELEARL
ncbi:carbohydrate kinase [Pseudonocardia sp. HH130630-07]|nr:carbohydrate kinase [Pseudonocardia sp. HH130630-07]